MNLSKIISISGMPGLFKVIAQSKNGLIVESLTDKKRFPALASQRISALDNISIYLTSGETAPLADVLKKIFEKQSGNPAPDSKSASDEEVKKYFTEVLPEYDKEKVHLSDIRKTLLWYNLLQKTDIFTKKDEEKKEETPVIAEDAAKKPESFVPRHEMYGKHLHPGGGAPRKTFGVRKTGEG
jgi:hypothetical protein